MGVIFAFRRRPQWSEEKIGMNLGKLIYFLALSLLGCDGTENRNKNGDDVTDEDHAGCTGMPFISDLGERYYNWKCIGECWYDDDPFSDPQSDCGPGEYCAPGENDVVGICLKQPLYSDEECLSCNVEMPQFCLNRVHCGKNCTLTGDMIDEEGYPTDAICEQEFASRTSQGCGGGDTTCYWSENGRWGCDYITLRPCDWPEFP